MTNIAPLVDRLDIDMDGTLGLSGFAGYQPRATSDASDSDRSGTSDASEIAGRVIAAFDSDGNEVLNADELTSVPIVWPVEATALTSISSR